MSIRDTFQIGLPGKRFLAVEKLRVSGSPSVVTSQVVLVRLAEAMKSKTLPVVSKQYSIQQFGQPDVQLIGKLGIALGTAATVEGKCAEHSKHPKRRVFEVLKINGRPCKPRIFTIPSGVEIEIGQRWQGKVFESVSTGDVGFVCNEYSNQSTPSKNKSQVSVPYLIGGMLRFDRMYSHLTPLNN